MRKFMKVAVLACATLGFPLVSCAGEGPRTAVPPGQESPAFPPQDPWEGQCDFGHWIGKPVNEDALRATRRPYRILAPGAQVTMEYMFGRINVIAGEDGIVQEVTCG